MYYYVKNIQGDIIKIVNEDGSLAYTYDYDAWGALLSIKDNQGHTIKVIPYPETASPQLGADSKLFRVLGCVLSENSMSVTFMKKEYKLSKKDRTAF